jgi:hypothetical protein
MKAAHLCVVDYSEPLADQIAPEEAMERLQIVNALTQIELDVKLGLQIFRKISGQKLKTDQEEIKEQLLDFLQNNALNLNQPNLNHDPRAIR